MACNCSKNKVIVYVATAANGQEKTFASEARAKAWVDEHGGSYAQVRR